MLDVLECGPLQDCMPVDDFEKLRLECAERDMQRSEVRQIIPDWMNLIGSDREEAAYLERIIFEERQAIAAMNASIQGFPLNESPDELDFESDK